MLIVFIIFLRHYVKINAKVGTDDSAESKDVEGNSEYFILINKKWRQQHGRTVNKSVIGQTGGGTRWREKYKWKHPQTLPMLQVATSLYLGS